MGRQLISCRLREAEHALGDGDEERAARALDAAHVLVLASSEPQWIGSFGTLQAERLRRGGQLEAARDAVQGTLDRIELCTDDVARLARVTAVGIAVESDLAQRARDLGEKSLERAAVARARIHSQRLQAAAQAGGPVERAWQAVGRAALARARGRNDPRLWLDAAAGWKALERPYPEASCRWRAAEAAVEVGDRAGAAGTAQTALAIARQLGAEWLVDELTALAASARLDLGTAALRGATDDHAGVPGREAGANGAPSPAEPAPFGLTPRESQVLALLAQGATNRQAGAALYMAEKTASVHVSRILSKLGVQTRTQAAALAHRQHLT